MMTYSALIIVAALAIGGPVHSAAFLGICDVFGGANSWHNDCAGPMLPDGEDGDLVVQLSTYCIYQQIYIDCMETKVLENNCANYVEIMAAVRDTLTYCENGDVADWISAAAPSVYRVKMDCISQANEIIRECYKCASKQFSYDFLFQGPPSIAEGVEEANRFKQSSFTCVRSELEKYFKPPSVPRCATTTWQGVYNMFVLDRANKLNFGVKLQESDLVSITGDGLQTETRRALLLDAGRHRKSTA